MIEALEYLSLLVLTPQYSSLSFFFSDFSLIRSSSYSVLSLSGSKKVMKIHNNEETKNMCPGLVVYSVIIVESALKGLATPLVREKILVFTRVGKSLPLA